MLFQTPAAALAAITEWRWPHFKAAELACRCHGRYCDGAYWHDPSFLDGLEALREQMRRPLIITSGHRCYQWNAAVGGAPLSQHKTIAADVTVCGHDRRELLNSAQRCGFTGIGLGGSFIHLDRRARPARWYYRGSRQLWQT